MKSLIKKNTLVGGKAGKGKAKFLKDEGWWLWGKRPDRETQGSEPTGPSALENPSIKGEGRNKVKKNGEIAKKAQRGEILL